MYAGQRLGPESHISSFRFGHRCALFQIEKRIVAGSPRWAARQRWRNIEQSERKDPGSQ